MEGLAYIYMALAYEEVQSKSTSKKTSEKFSLEELQYVASDRELSSEDVNQSYSNFCAAKF